MSAQSNPEAPALGRLERVPVREHWQNEARHFTPWLAKPENIRLLGEAIDIQLEFVSQEEPVGAFRADIRCKDTNDHDVLIENQLEPTDHGHLGQLLTYAAGLKAFTIVWIAKQFTEEHRAALDWLNNNTTQDVNFFGIEIELWKIGNSPLAPKFNIVSKPNDWSKVVREQALGGSAKELHFKFWTQFRQYLDEDRRSPIHMGKPSSSATGNVNLGQSPFRLIPWNVLSNSSGLWVRFTGPDANAINEKIAQDFRPQVEEKLSPLRGELIWLPQDAQKVVLSLRRHSTLAKQETWQELNEWMAQALETTYELFSKIATSLSAEGFILDGASDTDVELAAEHREAKE
jgi:hypothetical protein